MKRKILVAEDSATQAEQIRLLLEGANYQVDLVSNGREGLDRVASDPPDLIVSDIVMPEMDGYCFCKEVKSSKKTKQIPFVLLTERKEPGDILKGLQHGADNFITKPFEEDYLLQRVRRIFENLDSRQNGHPGEEAISTVGGQRIVFTADKQQLIELLFSTLEEMVRGNSRLVESQRIIEEYTKELEAKVRDRTRQLFQAEKLATMGELLAGVAHELNNPLAVILGQVILLGRETEDELVKNRGEKIANAAERCVRIAKNFLMLARQQSPERANISLNQVVQEAVELLGYQLRVDNVQATLDLTQEPTTLWADAHQIQQVLVNLITNALQAMRETPPSGRRLVFRTRLDPEQDQVVLEVADTGTGIPPEVQPRVFDPFFTTKPLGQGTGLGLSLCKEIIEGHGGTIQAESPPGEGATFRIEIPLRTPSSTERKVALPAEMVPLRGKRILVVDDEPEIAGVLEDLLTLDDHRVETASNGAVALQKIAAGNYDLVVSDIRMPQLDGPGLYRELAVRHPELTRRFIFLTGDALTPETQQFLRDSGIPGMSKPFRVEDLRRVIRRVFES